jgi:hypothetical protein
MIGAIFASRPHLDAAASCCFNVGNLRLASCRDAASGSPSASGSLGAPGPGTAWRPSPASPPLSSSGYAMLMTEGLSRMVLSG